MGTVKKVMLIILASICSGWCHFKEHTTFTPIPVYCSANCLVIFKQFAYCPHTEVMLSNLSNFIGFVGLSDKYGFFSM